MMKKIFIAVMICVLIPVFASAATISDFNVQALVCGEKSIDESTARDLNNGMTMYQAGDCKVTFTMNGDNIEKVYVQGNGLSLLGYSMAAVQMFDSSFDNLIENSGRLFSVFLLSRQGEDQYGKTVAGEVFVFSPYNDEYIFYIGKK